MLLIGMSKLGWFVTLKISRLYFSLKRSVKRRHLDDGNVPALLPRLAENVAQIAAGEVGLKGISRGNR